MIRADAAGEDLDERALAGAVRAHEGVNLAGTDGERGGAQRDDRAVVLRDVRGVQQEIRCAVGHVVSSLSWRVGRSVRTGVPAEPAPPLVNRGRGSGYASPGPLQAMSSALV